MQRVVIRLEEHVSDFNCLERIQLKRDGCVQ